MDVSLATLRLIDAIADTGSIARAARLVGCSQPQATRALQKAELEMGLTLFTRTAAGSQPTPEGTLVIGWARGVLEAAAVLQTGVRSLKQRHDAKFAIAASLTLAEHLVPSWLRVFHDRHREVSVSLTAVNSLTVIAKVRQGKVDLGFIESPGAPSGLPQVVVGGDRLVLIVATDHPWAKRRRPVSFSELAQTPLVMRESGSGTRQAIDQALSDFGQAVPLVEVASAEGVRRLVAEGMGPALISELAAASALQAREVRQVPIERDITRVFRAIWPASSPLDGTLGDFVAQVRVR